MLSCSIARGSARDGHDARPHGAVNGGLAIRAAKDMAGGYARPGGAQQYFDPVAFFSPRDLAAPRATCLHVFRETLFENGNAGLMAVA